MSTYRGSRLYVNKFQRATEANDRNVILLDGRFRYPLERLFAQLDAVTFIRMSRTCREMSRRARSVRGLSLPFDIGSVFQYFTSTSMVKHGMQKWNIDLASKYLLDNPNFRPFVSKVQISPRLVSGMLQRMTQVLSQMGVGKVKELIVCDVDRNEWNELQGFLITYRVTKVIFLCPIPYERQISIPFLTIQHLEQKGHWSVDYIASTKRSTFRLRPDFLANPYVVVLILARWCIEDFSFWEVYTPNRNFIALCKEKFRTVSPDQRSAFPKNRTIFCDFGEKKSVHTLAFLKKDGTVNSVECSSVENKVRLRIQPLRKNKYPAVFKRILGIQQ